MPHTLPLYAFVRAYSSMEFGYAAALALAILTLLLLTVVWLYVRRASQGSRPMTDRRSAARRFLEVELVLAILALRSRCHAWMGPDIHQAPGGAFALAGPLSPGERRPRSLP